MSEQLQLRRGTAAQVAAFTGAQGETVMDTTNNRLVVNDGSTAGGFPAAKLSEVVTNTRTGVSDTAYTVLATDRMVAYTALTAARVVTLPASSAYPLGTRLLVIDETGNCSVTKTLTLTPNGTDTIDGAASAVVNQAYGYIAIESNQSGAWTIVDQALGMVGTQVIAQSQHGASMKFQIIEQLITCSGATTNIPLGATVVMLAVSLYVVTAVTGCTSITINDSQNGNGHWGSGIGVSAGSTNAGVAPSGAYYNGLTTLALAAVGGGASFTGGTVRVSVLAMVATPPSS